MRQISAAYDAAEQVADCQDCGYELEEMDGKIAIDVDGSNYYVPCPLLTQQCRYGQALLQQLDKYALDVVKAIPNLPLRFHQRLEEPQRTGAVRGVNTWNTDKKCFLVLHGDHGTGKSFGAAYALWVFARKRNAANWNKPFLWGKLGAMWVSPYQLVAKDDLLEAAQKVPVLVIDDLGSEIGMPRYIQKINEIIAKRYDRMVLTIITTNEDTMNFETLYKRRFVERVIDGGELVCCNGESLRLAS